jgi:SAM-dependent methyltransferase
MTLQNDHWKLKHQTDYKNTDWIHKPSLFARDAVRYFPPRGRVLDLGAGQGQDSRYFAQQGYDVVSTDLEDAALALNLAKTTGITQGKINIKKLDLTEPFPFKNQEFDVVYAHLSLHYFDTPTTHRIFSEVHRVLKKGGVFAFFVNSVDDPQYGTGPQLETDYFQIEKIAKRFFSLESASFFTERFETVLLDNKGETYKDREKGVHGLIRFVGKT